MAFWYLSTATYPSIAQWAASTAYTVGQIVRQLATPAAGNERAFRATAAGTSGSTEPGWAIGNGGVTTDGGVTWQEVTGNGAYAWAAAGPRIQTVRDKMGNGDTIFVSSDHNETFTADMSVQIPSVQNNGSSIISVNRAGSVPPTSADLAIGALFAAAGNITIQPVGLARIYGVTFRAGVGQTAYKSLQLGGNAAKLIMAKCRVELATTASNAQILLTTKVDLEDVTTKWAAIGQNISGDGPELTWMNSATVPAVDASGSIPTNLFGSMNATIHCYGLDLSALGARIYDHTGNPNGMYVDLRNCKLSASFAPPSPFLLNAAELIYVNCDSGSTNYKYGKVAYTGAETTETTIVRTGGGTDGATPASRKIVTNGNPSKLLPFKVIPFVIWVAPTGAAQTVTVYGLAPGGMPNTDDVWLDVEYEGSSGSPQSAFATSAPALLAAGAALPSDASTWGGSGTPFKLAVSITPQKAGYVNLMVRVAKTNATLYFDTKSAVA